MQQIDAFSAAKPIKPRKNKAEQARAVAALQAGFDAAKAERPYFSVLVVGQFGARTPAEHGLHVKAWRYGHWLAQQGRPRPQ